MFQVCHFSWQQRRTADDNPGKLDIGLQFIYPNILMVESTSGVICLQFLSETFGHESGANRSSMRRASPSDARLEADTLAAVPKLPNPFIPRWPRPNAAQRQRGDIRKACPEGRLEANTQATVPRLPDSFTPRQPQPQPQPHEAESQHSDTREVCDREGSGKWEIPDSPISASASWRRLHQGACLQLDLIDSDGQQQSKS